MIVRASALCALMLGSTATRASEEMCWKPNKMTFEVEPSVGGYELSVTGPGDFSVSAAFSSKQEIVFSSKFFDEGVIGDGAYTWELKELEGKQIQGRSGRIGPDDTNGREEGTVVPSNMYADWVASGAFSVRGGVIVNPNQRAGGGGEGNGTCSSLPSHLPSGETNASALRLHGLHGKWKKRKGTIPSSACIGDDCTDKENFGFDTLRLKEGELRIHFEDTSTDVDSPANDWRIVINDSANGGENYFAVEDSTAGRIPFRIDAGAPANSLRVDSGGNLGIRNMNPNVEIHSKAGDTPTLRLEQDGSSGFTPQSWDFSSNETNMFIRDNTNGSKLPFRIRPGAPTSSIDINPEGKIGLGIGNPLKELHIKSKDPPNPAAIRLDDGASGSCDITCATVSKSVGEVAGTSFTAADEADVVFQTPMPNANYIVMLTPVVQAGSDAVPAVVRDKTVNGFTIVVNDKNDISSVGWVLF